MGKTIKVMAQKNEQISLSKLKPTVLMAIASFTFVFFTSFVSLIPNAKAASKKVEYTCNEGIPLIVEYINTKAASIAIISHDSSPRIALDSIPSGSGAKYSNGDWILHVKGKEAQIGTQGQFDDSCTELTKSVNNDGNRAAITFPRKAKSWGGIVRAGPGQNYRKKASLREGEWVTLLERTNKVFQDRPWFKIKYRGRIGYKWGGILCSVGDYVEGTYQVCN